MLDKKNNFLSSKAKAKYIKDSNIYDFDFYSKAFIIRYQEEIIELDDMCHFRIELNAYPDLDEQNFFLEVEFLFADLSSQQQQDTNYEEYKKTATYKGKLHNSFNGILEYVPITFDSMHFCLINATVHTLLIDFKFRN